MRGKRDSYRLPLGKLDGRRPLRRPRRNLADNIKMDLIQIEWGGVDWIVLAQDRENLRALMNAVMNLRVQ
jgi:hypothetical protein